MAKPDWKLLEVFVRVAQHRSLTAGAKQLGVSQPTASRYVEQLEQSLGSALFVRHSRGLELTDRGAELFAAAQSLDASVEAMFRRAAGRETTKGTVRVSVNEPLGVLVLPTAFAGLRRDYPEVAVELVIETSVANLSRRDADVAVRMFRPEQLDLVARKVGSVALGLFASRAYLKKHGEPRQPTEFAAHTLIGFDRDPSFAHAAAQFGLKPAQFAFRTDSILAQIETVIAGVGIAGLHLGIAKRHPSLVRVLPQISLAPLETWVVMHRDLRSDAAVRVVFDRLCEVLVEYCRL